MLTRKQFELLMFIHERLKEAGVPPSFDEMKAALVLRSKSGILRRITALVEVDRPWATAFWTAVGYPLDDRVVRHVGTLGRSA